MLTFEETVKDLDARLSRESLRTIQVNLGARCNQACVHCHIGAGPHRSETMDRATAVEVLALVDAARAETVDLTGGAPELCSSFRFLIHELSARGLHVIDRSNLTVFLEPGMSDLPQLLADAGVDIVASLPCYTSDNVDAQRGPGVYDKSLDVLRELNAMGYGCEGSGLELDLVYNPLGAKLPGPQAALEADYRQELRERAGIVFNRLFTLTNMPLGRYARQLAARGEREEYSDLLTSSFNPDTLSNLMCLDQVSVSWDGRLYDCDFNQVLGLECFSSLRLGASSPVAVVEGLLGAPIHIAEHCWACTAGSGSSCGGSIA